MSVRNDRRVPENRDNGKLYHPVNLLRVVHVLGQLLDSVEHFLSDIVTFKSQVTSDCEADPRFSTGSHGITVLGLPFSS